MFEYPIFYFFDSKGNMRQHEAYSKENLQFYKNLWSEILDETVKTINNEKISNAYENEKSKLLSDSFCISTFLKNFKQAKLQRNFSILFIKILQNKTLNGKEFDFHTKTVLAEFFMNHPLNVWMETVSIIEIFKHIGNKADDNA